MSVCQSVRYALGICAICFLLNGISSVEDTVREQMMAANTAIEPEGRALFNPRVDYNNQWTPVGHADPLKNDPTYDYVPPTSVSVRYWSESAESQNNTNDKSEILLLGVPVEHSVHMQSNHLPQLEMKLANRRSSPYYPPEPSRVLTPPSEQAFMSSFDQDAGAYYTTPSSGYWNNDLSQSYSNDAYPEESASYVTVIRPKTHPHPYASTIYNKNTLKPILNLAANVNSLEPVERNKHWIQSLLQKEIAYQTEPTTPQVVIAYSPSIYEPYSTTSMPFKVPSLPSDTASIRNSFAEPTTTTTTTLAPMTTDSIFSHYKQPVIPAHGPMYLIIQGHSKVKTYGADYPEKHEPKMVPVTVKNEEIVRHIVTTDANGPEIQVKHLHKMHTPTINSKSTKPSKKVTNSAMDSLLSLLDSSLASFGSMADKGTKNKSNDLMKTTEKTTSTTKIMTILGPTTIRTNAES